VQATVRILVGLVALLFLGLGLNLLFNPDAGAAQFALVPEGIRGLNSIRGDLGGLFVGAATLLGIGLVRREATWLLAVAVVIGAIALGRLVGFLLDGLAGNSIAQFAVEVAIVAVLLVAHRQARSSA
jgi:hypothetical protein